MFYECKENKKKHGITVPIIGGLTLAKDEKKFDNAIEVYGIWDINNKQNENPNSF